MCGKALHPTELNALIHAHTSGSSGIMQSWRSLPSIRAQDAGVLALGLGPGADDDGAGSPYYAPSGRCKIR